MASEARDVRPAKTADGTDSHGFLGPLYTKPGKNLGPEPVRNAIEKVSVPDVLGLNKTKGARKGGKKGY
jgi:hypothetical protein